MADRREKLLVTTSWDDGNRLDLRILGLLEKYGLRGTFYIPRSCPEFKSLSDDEVRLIAQTQEIGAHTINHRYLAQTDAATARQEISDSKDYIAKLIGQSAEMFCYPGGSFNASVKEAVRGAGFAGARTVIDLQSKAPIDPFEFGTTIHAYPFPFKTSNLNAKLLIRQFFAPLQGNFLRRLDSFHLPFYSYRNWHTLAEAVFDDCLEKGDYFHLWGHSWEIERYGLWNGLEKIFKHISRRADCSYVTNGEAVARLNRK